MCASNSSRPARSTRQHDSGERTIPSLAVHGETQPIPGPALLLDVAHNLAVAAGERAPHEFVELGIQLAEVWRGLAGWSVPLVQPLYDQLAVQHTELLWLLKLRLRAG